MAPILRDAGDEVAFGEGGGGAAEPEEAAAERAKCPQTAFGTMDLFEWGVCYADLSVP